MKVEVFIGPEAEKLLANIDFCEDWRKLSIVCPWASVFQEVEFVKTWYATYKSRYTPVIVTEVNEEGKKTGLFTLATDVETGELVPAGDRFTEYAAWLADPKYGDRFIESAIEKLREIFPNRCLTLLFALPTLPVNWTHRGKRFSGNCHLVTQPRGLMAVGDGSIFRDGLRKRNQNKINRLKRIGEVQFARIEAPEELQEVIDEIFCYQNLRLRAVYNTNHLALAHDQLKKTFFLNLMRLPGMLHVTVLRVGDKLVSGQIHMHNRDQVLLGLITHSPFFSKYSPGTLHLLMLGSELAKKGVPTFDLTPGGEYKDRYATAHDDAYVLRIFFNRTHCIKFKIARKFRGGLKRLARALKVLPPALEAHSTLLDYQEKFSYLNLKMTSLLSEIGRTLKRSLWHTDESSIYFYSPEHLSFSPELSPLNRDHIPDLLAYRPMETWQPPVNKFLKQAMRNLETGHHVYTRVEDGKLVQFAWLTVPQNITPAIEDDWYTTLPAESAVITDYFTCAPDNSLTRASLFQILRDARKIHSIKHVYICASADNLSLKHAVEEAGFTYLYCLLRRKVLGKVTRLSKSPNPQNDLERKTTRVVTSPPAKS
jgi:CelD/BcsL family acetyltransferase involved in cellulose biosynthesis